MYMSIYVYACIYDTEYAGRQMLEDRSMNSYSQTCHLLRTHWKHWHCWRLLLSHRERRERRQNGWKWLWTARKKKTKNRVFRRLEHEFQTDRARGEASEIEMMLFLREGKAEMTAMKEQREREGERERERRCYVRADHSKWASEIRVLSFHGCGREWWSCRRNKKPVSSFYCHTLSSLVSPLFSHFVLLFVRPILSSPLSCAQSFPLLQCLFFHFACHFHPLPSFLHHLDWRLAPLPWLLSLYGWWKRPG